MENNKSMKKALKMALLLVTSLLIGYVSAESYTELFMYGTNITIIQSKVYFVPGSDTNTISSAGIEGNGTTVTFDQIQIKPGEVLIYEEAVNITNKAGASKTITLSLDSISGAFTTNNFEYINVSVIATNGSTMGNVIHIVPPGGSGSNTTTTGPIIMPNDAEWAIKWVIKAANTATVNDSINVTIEVKVE